MEGLLQAGLDLIKNRDLTPVRDAGLIITSQKAQHYEIAGYGCASAIVRLLGRENEERLLHQNIEEEKQADAALSEIANHAINIAAAAAA